MVDHCIFRGLKISAGCWGGGTAGHAMRSCVNDGPYGSAVWTAEIADDFDYRNNVVTNGEYAWTYQDPQSATTDAARLRGRRSRRGPVHDVGRPMRSSARGTR